MTPLKDAKIHHIFPTIKTNERYMKNAWTESVSSLSMSDD